MCEKGTGGGSRNSLQEH